MYKILIIGSGGREHIIGKRLKDEKNVVIFAPGNGGTSLIGENVNVDPENFNSIYSLVKEKNIDFIVVGPEKPLVDGIVDFMREKDVKIFGTPSQGAKLEGNKYFAKDFMKRYNIPTANFEYFYRYEDAIKFLEKSSYPMVIKASGLAAGKGSFIVYNLNEANSVLNKIMVERIFGEAGKTVVIEEFLKGEECSYMVLWTKKGFIPFVTSQDHKRIFDGDMGVNTGGMGAYAPNPLVDSSLNTIIKKTIVDKVFDGLTKENINFSGVLYIGIMVTESGPKVLEFNVRFGDPEAQVVIPLMENSFTEMLLSSIENEIPELKFKHKYALCTVLASKGYPWKYEKGYPIKGDLADNEDTFIVFAGVKRERDKFITSGGRVLNVVSLDQNLKKAKAKVYKKIEKIDFDGMYFRKDIGDKGIKIINKEEK